MSLELDAKKTALVAIDLQNGILGRPGMAPVDAATVVERTNEIARALRAQGGTVVWVRVLMAEIKPWLADQAVQLPPEIPASASELADSVEVQQGDIVLGKRQWGAFYGTNLEQALDRRGVETIILTGVATNLGVESTARAAVDTGYNVVFAADAMTTVSAEWHRFSVENLFPRLGRVRTTAEIVAALSE